MLLGNRIDDVAVHDEGRRLGKRIHESGIRIRDQQHVALVDGSPSPDTGPVHSETVFKRAEIYLAHRIGNVVLQTRDVREAKIELLGVVLLGEIQHFLWTHKPPNVGVLKRAGVTRILHSTASRGRPSTTKTVMRRIKTPRDYILNKPTRG